jgi:hypothetical protein
MVRDFYSNVNSDSGVYYHDLDLKSTSNREFQTSMLSGRTKQKIRLSIFQDRPTGGIVDCTYKARGTGCCVK